MASPLILTKKKKKECAGGGIRTPVALRRFFYREVRLTAPSPQHVKVTELVNFFHDKLKESFV